MLPEKIDSLSMITNKESRIETIVKWFEHNLASFYMLGRCYLGNEERMEELFFQVIETVYRKSSRYKDEISFKAWVTALFIQTCKELATAPNLHAMEGNDSLMSSIAQLKGQELDVVAYTYIGGISKKETAHLLGVSEGELKKLLLAAMGSIRQEFGYETVKGCHEFHKDYIDYLERSMERSKKIEFEIHLYHCHNCQEDLSSFQEIMLSLEKLRESNDALPVSTLLMDKIRNRLVEEENERKLKKKKRNRTGVAFAIAMIFLLGVGVFTGVFSHVYYAWSEEDEELRPYLQHGLGERLNLEAESNGVKIKIKSAIADELQTLIFYEIEDMTEEHQYVMYYEDGVTVANEYQIMDQNTYPRYYPYHLLSSSDEDEDEVEKNVSKGKMSLRAIKPEEGVIELNISRLQKINPESINMADPYYYGNFEYKSGEWNFEIPVTKIPTVEYALEGETEVEGVKVRFDKLTIAPTATILQYGIHFDHLGKQIQYLDFANLKVNKEKVNVDRYSGGSFYGSHNMNWASYQAYFDPLFGGNPKNLQVQLRFAQLTVMDPMTFLVDPAHGFPQVFEYAGSPFSIDKLEIGKPTEIVISTEITENRVYESLHLNVMSEGLDDIESTEMSSDGVFLDKNGKEFNMENYHYDFNQTDPPRYFQTVQTLRFSHRDREKEVVPTRIEISGYNTMKYLDDVVEVTVKELDKNKK